jgi:hypothetical protein
MEDSFHLSASFAPIKFQSQMEDSSIQDGLCGQFLFARFLQGVCVWKNEKDLYIFP